MACESDRDIAGEEMVLVTILMVPALSSEFRTSSGVVWDS
jgi:hypothetical protein